MNYLRRWVGGLLVASVAVLASAQEPGLEVRLDPRKFGIEDAARLEIRIVEPPSAAPAIDPGPLNNLRIVSGPSTGTEFSWINGRATRASSFTYLLRGLEVGPASVGPVTVTIGGAELRAEAVTAEIVPGSVVHQRQAGRRSPFALDPLNSFFARRQPAARAPRVALRQLVSARKVVVGQPVLATLVLDTTTGGVDGFEWVTAPSYPGWWAQRVEPPERVTGDVVEVNGVRFNRFVVARHTLVPLKAGRLVVPEVEARIGFRSHSLFDPQQILQRATRVITIDVRLRPTPPEGFSGAVGELRYSAGLSPVSIDFGESAVLSIELKGSGNLPLVEAPARWPDCEGCEGFPPEEESRVTVDAQGIHGARIWRTTLVPRVWGELDLEPVTLAVFDPSAGRYRSQTLGPLRLEVAPPPPTPTPVVTEVVQPTEGNAAGLGNGSTGASSPRARPPWIWVGGALLFGLLAGGLATLFAARRRTVSLNPRQAGQSPSERARELQIALERWWVDARTRARGRSLEGDLQELRRELEAVRFAPSRADHTHTVTDLEERVRRLMRRA
ncbi:MAG: BatD family protein [Thermoanaerobaculales bacterium]